MGKKYKIENIILDKDKSFVEANIKNLKNLLYYSYIVGVSDARRLDLISERLYNTVDLKWLVLYLNEISDVSDVSEGRIIKYCSYRDYVSSMLEVMERL